MRDSCQFGEGSFGKMPTKKDVKGDGSLVGAQFFRTGMEHFRRHHEGAGEMLSCRLEMVLLLNPEFPSVFLVVSDDMGWCKRNLAANDTFMVGGNSPQVLFEKSA